MPLEFIVSACLAGFPCAYDGRPRERASVRRLLEEGRALAACPECLGGLAVPRVPAEIYGGPGSAVWQGKARVLDREGRDVTAYFCRGAELFLAIAQTLGIKKAILKSRSPSCGCGFIYDGTFSGKLRPGDGVAAALLRARGFVLWTEHDWESEAGEL
ncbi:DUF523 domain-containing protein [Ammonifex thiophilus]|uniref:DUF523 domain-containing protein n=1 Tax=Ammonifex thiophilus TaxID=444093 RepID=A0A3D8P1W0_9THEO|nr:DUF523 domain-containing protein [Ammonifex thiophilus]RDV82053.1 DUF523 domain-containing protein [Ammonifex thiophilus]